MEKDFLTQPSKWYALSLSHGVTKGPWLVTALFSQCRTWEIISALLLCTTSHPASNFGCMWEALSPGALPATEENELSWTQSLVPAGKGVAIPCSGECPEPFSEMAFIGIGMRRGVQYAYNAHWSMSQGYSYRKQTLSIDTNWRNTEICLRPGCVRHPEARWLLSPFMRWGVDSFCVWTSISDSWPQGYPKQSKPQGIQCVLQAPSPSGTLSAGTGSCLPPALLAFGRDLQASFQALLARTGLQSPIPHKVVPNSCISSL